MTPMTLATTRMTTTTAMTAGGSAIFEDRLFGACATKFLSIQLPLSTTLPRTPWGTTEENCYIFFVFRLYINVRHRIHAYKEINGSKIKSNISFACKCIAAAAVVAIHFFPFGQNM